MAVIFLQKPPLRLWCACLLLGVSATSLSDEGDTWASVFAFQKKMAEYGHPEAQVKLGEMYEEGRGSEKDYDKAQHWYQKAADQGYAPAREKLARLKARQIETGAAKTALSAEEEQLARQRAEEAIKQMLTTPDAFSED